MEGVVAQTSGLMIELIAAFSMQGLGAMADGDQQGGSVACCSVHSTPTPTVEPMATGNTTDANTSRI